MDLARLLTDDTDRDDRTDNVRDKADSGIRLEAHTRDAITHAATTVASLTPVYSRRPTKRQRKPTVAFMQTQIATYECIVAALPHVLRDANTSTSASSSTRPEDEDTSNPDAQRMRRFLRHALKLSQDIQTERLQRDDLLRLLKHHYDRAASLSKLTRGLSLDDWHWTCERWRTLSLELYTPLTDAHCYALVQETLCAIKSYHLPRGLQKQGANYFGWRESHTLANDQRFVHFITRKTLWRSDIDACVARTWSIYEDADLYKKTNLGEHCEFFHQVLQRMGDDGIVLQTIEKYPGMPRMIHSLSLVFRVKTDTGYLMALRSVETSPGLRQWMASEGLSLSGNCYWNALDVVQRDAHGACVAIQDTVAGYIGSDDRAYAQRWLTEIAVSLVRAEMAVMGTPLVAMSAEGS